MITNIVDKKNTIVTAKASNFSKNDREYLTWASVIGWQKIKNLVILNKKNM